MKYKILIVSIILIVLSSLILFLSIGIIRTEIKPQSNGPIRIIDSELFIDNSRQPFLIKGICYEPVNIGKYPNGMDWGDESIYIEDFPEIMDMGFNTIRTFRNSKALFKQASMYGLWVCPVFLIDGTVDFSDEEQKNAIKAEFENFISTYKDEPSLLFWIIGNEQNYANGNCPEWYDLADEMAYRAYIIEGGKYHPVAIGEGDIGNIGNPDLHVDDESLPNIDIWACNVYRGNSFNAFFEEFREKSNKALFISEYGVDSWDSFNTYFPEYGKERQDTQQDIDLALWDEIMPQGMPVIGGCVFSYSDEWWKDFQGETYKHEYGGIRGNGQPDGFFNEEWWGLTKRSKKDDIIGKGAAYRYGERLKIYVDESGNAGREDGTIENPYLSIQDAIDSAKSGDIIQINPGKYLLHDYLLINKSVTLIGDILRPHRVEIKRSYRSAQGGYNTIKTGNNLHVNLIGLTINGRRPFGLGSFGEYSKIVINKCRILSSNSDLICKPFSEVRAIGNIFYSSGLKAKPYSKIFHQDNVNFRYTLTGNNEIKKIPPAPLLFVTSNTVIKRNGFYNNIRLKISWNRLEVNRRYTLKYMLINIPQGEPAAWKGNSEWRGGRISIDTPGGNMLKYENLIVYNWSDLLWVFNLIDQDGNLVRSFTLKPKIILDIGDNTRKQILSRNPDKNIDVDFKCKWDNLKSNQSYKLSYRLTDSSGNESAANDNRGTLWRGEEDIPIQGPRGYYTNRSTLSIFKQKELKWIIQIKDQYNNLIDESHFIPRAILNQTILTPIQTNIRKNYKIVYSIKSRTEVNDDFIYEVNPEKRYRLFYILVENDTINNQTGIKNHWACAWDNKPETGPPGEWHGDNINAEGIDIFNPLIKEKDLTVYNYNNFWWIAELYEQDEYGNEELKDKIITPVSKQR